MVFVSGYPDPGMTAFFGKPIRAWASYRDWGRAVAASGLVGITYGNRTPADVDALVAHLRANAVSLAIDPARVGAWSCSGNAPDALGLMTRTPLTCAALLYPFLLDVDGATALPEAAAKFYFAAPPITIDDLPDAVPMLIVRAGADQTPALNVTLDRFVAAARTRGLPVTLIDHPDAPHAFDLVDDRAATHAVTEQVLDFLRRNLA